MNKKQWLLILLLLLGLSVATFTGVSYEFKSVDAVYLQDIKEDMRVNNTEYTMFFCEKPNVCKAGRLSLSVQDTLVWVSLHSVS